MTEDVLALSPEVVSSMGRHALYRFYSDNGDLLYVGTSGDFGRRFPAHAQKIWFLQVRGITLEWYGSEDDALKAERRAIYVEHPRYNVQHRDLKALPMPSPRHAGPQQKGRDRVLAALKSSRRLRDALAGSDMAKRVAAKDELAEKAGVSVRTVERIIRESAVPNSGGVSS